MDFIKELLAKNGIDPEKAGSLAEEVGKELPKHYIPKGRFNEVNEELKIMKTQLDENKKSMEELSQKASSVSEYEKKISELTQKNKEIEEISNKQIAQITKKTQLKELLLVNHAHKDALELLVEKYSDIAEIDKGAIKDPDGLLQKIKAERAGLFVEIKNESQDQGGNKKAPGNDESDRLRKLYGLK